MRVLIISDSHGRGMAQYLESDYQWFTRTVLVARTTTLVRDEYRNRLPGLQDFYPDAILIHVGHNDVERHPTHNPHPMVSLLAFTEIVRFMGEIEKDFPYSRIIYSSLFPRTTGSEWDRVRRRHTISKRASTGRWLLALVLAKDVGLC